MLFRTRLKFSSLARVDVSSNFSKKRMDGRIDERIDFFGMGSGFRRRNARFGDESQPF
jgi:hypothetical protein